MTTERLLILADYDDETAIQLIDSAYQYLLDKQSVPLKKLSLQIRVPFSAIYQFLRTQPGRQIDVVDDSLAHLSEKVRDHLKEKIFLLYGQNYQKVGLLTNYKQVVAERPTITEYSSLQKYLQLERSIVPAESLDQSPTLGRRALNYSGMQWKVNVVISTNVLDKVLRPEIVLEMMTAEGERITMTVNQEKLEELRRQVALLLRQSQQIECIKYLQI